MASIAIIPARGGSKGIKNKNIKELLGQPLISYSIKAALDSGCFGSVIVTSDDPQILKIALLHEGVQALRRPDHLATDSATSNVVIEHVLGEHANLKDADQICLLQPTSPLRTHHDITSAIELFETKQPDLVLSAYRPKIEVQKAFVLEKNGFLTGLLSASAPFSRRQDLPEVFLPNGAIYVCSVGKFKKKNILPQSRILPYIMGIENSVDIDTIEDFNEAERILKLRRIN
jgi:CMP-N,N'-diacetyllegionaminic acid synthase